MRYARSVSIVVVFFVAFATLTTPSVGQESNRVQEWSKKFEDIRTRMKQVAGAIEERVKRFQGTDVKATHKFRSEVGIHREEIHKLVVETQTLRGEIHANRNDLDTEDYQRAMQEFSETMEEYSGALEEYSKAMEKFSEAMEKYSGATREPHKPAIGAREDTGTHPADSPRNRNEPPPWIKAREDTKKRLASELDQLSKDLDFKKDAEVVALRDAKLMSGEETVGNVQRGEKLTVERVQGEWLYVRNGWIFSKHVISAPLMAWYGRLEGNSSVEHAGRTRGKCHGFMFDIINAGSDLYDSRWGPNTRVNGQRVPSGGGENVNSQNVGVFLRKAGDRRRELLISFPGSVRPFPNLPALRSHGMVEQGDYISISTNDRQVFVNGEQRRPGRR